MIKLFLSKVIGFGEYEKFIKATLISIDENKIKIEFYI